MVPSAMLTILMFFFVSTCLTTTITCLLFAGAKTYQKELSKNDIEKDNQESKYNANNSDISKSTFG